MSVDPSTIGLTIGLDVLEHLIKLSENAPKTVTNYAIIGMARNAAIEARENAQSIPYETEGMAEIRRLLTDDGVMGVKVDHFIGCLVLLEKHGFRLNRQA